MLRIFLVAIVIVNTCESFTVTKQVQQQQHHAQSRIVVPWRQQQKSQQQQQQQQQHQAKSSSLVVVSSVSSVSSLSSTSTDLFESYSITDPNQTDLVYIDTVIGSGDSITNGNVITVAYEGRLLSTNKKFDSGTGFSFRLGDGKVIPGWEKGLIGMKVGGKRTIRIPPNLAYGERGAKDVIPANAHLEFDCELKKIASNPIDEITSQINMQPERIITFFVLLALVAVTPYLPI